MHATLGKDDLPLYVHDLVRRDQPRHPVRLVGHAGFQVILWNALVVIGIIPAGRIIVIAAD